MRSQAIRGTIAVLIPVLVGACHFTGPREPVELVVSPMNDTLGVGETVTLKAQLIDTNGDAIPVSLVEWASSDTAIASVDAAGNVTGLAEGTVTITAHSGELEASASLTVYLLLAYASDPEWMMPCFHRRARCRPPVASRVAEGGGPPPVPREA